jgi:AcrR family transcriptional regulator
MNKAETIENIIAAATREINLKGVDRASISTIAENAGVTKQLVYHYFKNKDILYSAVLESVANGIRLTKNIEIYDTLSPVESINHIIDTIISGFSRNPNYVILALDQSLHENNHISKNNEFISSMNYFVDNVFSLIIKKGKEKGTFRKSLDSRLAFWMIFNLVSSGFLNSNMMLSVSEINMQSNHDIELWRISVRDFVLNALLL